MLCRISVPASPLSAYTVLPFGDARRWTYRSRSTTLTREIVLLADVEAFLDPFFEVVIGFFHVVEERFGFTSLDLPSGQSSGSARGGHGSQGRDEQGSYYEGADGETQAAKAEPSPIRGACYEPPVLAGEPMRESRNGRWEVS